MANITQGSAGYEFNDYENIVVGDVQKLTSFVGTFWMVIGGLYVTLAALLFEMAAKHAAMIGVSGGVALGLVVLDNASLLGAGIFTRKASGSLRIVVETHGNDIPNMMKALGDLRTMYWMYAVTLAVDLGTDLIGLMVNRGAS